MADPKSGQTSSPPGEDVKAQSIIERTKKEIQVMLNSPHHDKETHGTSNDIDKDTPIDEVKGPNVFERAKEEIEALVETINPKK